MKQNDKRYERATYIKGWQTHKWGIWKIGIFEKKVIELYRTRIRKFKNHFRTEDFWRLNYIEYKSK